MDLRAALQGGEGETSSLYPMLLAAQLYVRVPLEQPYAVSRPGTAEWALPAFLTEEEGAAFWGRVSPGQPITLAAFDFPLLASAAQRTGALVIDPEGAGLLLERGELRLLAHGEIPGELTAWLKGLGRLARQPSEVIARLRRSHLHVITGREKPGEAPRLHLLEKSEDGTLAVPCFSSPETLAQFVAIRRLESKPGLSAALVEGEYCLRAASGMGAYLLIDPESPWETQLEPTLL